MGSGDSIQATVSYTGLTLKLKLLDLVTNKTFTFSQAINIPQIVGANTAYVGFTGGTGTFFQPEAHQLALHTTQAVHPDFSPGGGIYSSPQIVKLTSRDRRRRRSDYTTNGWTPDTRVRSQITGPITVRIRRR